MAIVSKKIDATSASETARVVCGQKNAQSGQAPGGDFFEYNSTKSVEIIKTYIDSHWRSIFKALTWRLMGSVGTFLIAWLATGEIRVSATIGLGDMLIKVGAFYLHERVWDHIQFGRKPLPPPL